MDVIRRFSRPYAPGVASPRCAARPTIPPRIIARLSAGRRRIGRSLASSFIYWRHYYLLMGARGPPLEPWRQAWHWTRWRPPRLTQARRRLERPPTKIADHSALISSIEVRCNKRLINVLFIFFDKSAFLTFLFDNVRLPSGALPGSPPEAESFLYIFTQKVAKS